MAPCALYAFDSWATGQEHCCVLQALPGEAAEPKGWSITVSPKRFPKASSNHVESNNGQGAVGFEASGGISIHGSYSHKITLCASACPGDTIPELSNCTLNQMKFNLQQQHPVVTDLSEVLEEPQPSSVTDSLC